MRKLRTLDDGAAETFRSTAAWVEEDPLAAYRAVRAATRALAEPLSPEDMVVQSMPEASPVKWHLAHTTWFFETFFLPAAGDGTPPFDPGFAHLFNSYYEGVGPFHPRPRRGLLTRPGLARVAAYREEIDRRVCAVLERADLDERARFVLQVGVAHEQQHQELILTDVLHLLAGHPDPQVYRPAKTPAGTTRPMHFLPIDGGTYEVGAADGFSYDNERPRHRVLLAPYAVADRHVTCGEYLAFMEDGGYRRFDLWMSEGWDFVRRNGVEAPLYWERIDGRWYHRTLHGRLPVDPAAPLVHVSWHEATAYAQWAKARLPTEFEWEVAARRYGDPASAHFAHRLPHLPTAAGRGPVLFGDVWTWTSSAYHPYPGFHPDPGPLFEYNGKFMCNQYVLRGGSCITPAGHVRVTYRNYFPATTRWQFTGILLARDAG